MICETRGADPAKLCFFIILIFCWEFCNRIRILEQSSQDGVHISESVFASSSGNSQFQRQKDGDNYFRSCIGYAVCPGSQDRTPYQAECGVLSEVYFCQGPAKPPEEYAEEGSTLLLLFFVARSQLRNSVIMKLIEPKNANYFAEGDGNSLSLSERLAELLKTGIYPLTIQFESAKDFSVVEDALRCLK